MTEKNLIVDNRTITYKGIFQVPELFTAIYDTLDKLGYQKREKKTEELVVPSGKKTYVELRPFKIKSNSVTLMIKIKVHLDNVIEVTKEIDGIPKTFQQGDVTVIIDAWSLTDIGERWGMKPLFYFIKLIVNKYIYRYPTEELPIQELKTDVNQVSNQIKAVLNLYKYQVKE